MFSLSEVISVPVSVGFETLTFLFGSIALLPFFGFSFSSEESEQEGTWDIEDCKNRVAELEAVSARTIEQNEELANLYVDLANRAFEGGEDLQDVLDFLGNAESVLNETLSQGEDTEIRRQLGNVLLHRAVVLNDFDEMESAVESYNQAITALKPLDDKGDGEAKYDIAGIKLNLGTIYHELGDLEQAKAALDESFLAFRAVEKISTDMDTRYFMAKVSVAQGSLLRDLDEPLDKVVDAYNRAMRLYVELIDMGQMEHERELANALMDRCMATYEDYKGRDFDSETERLNKIGDVLIDVGRAIEILERIVANGGDEEDNIEARIDLFNAVTTQAAMLLDLEKFAEAKAIFDRAIQDFADFANEEDPVLLSQLAAAYQNRGFCSISLGDANAALDDFNRSIDICEKIQGAELDLEQDERTVFLPTLATYYANRANAHNTLGDKSAAQKDCQHGLDMIRSLREKFGDELEEIEQLFENLLKEMK